MIVSEQQIIVKPGQCIWYTIVVPVGSINAHVIGNFNASGGSGNDIQAAILDQMNLTNWVNGHQADGQWGTQGPQTVGKFDVVLVPGVYYLAFSNRHSIISEKQVFVAAELDYYGRVLDAQEF
jgi:hypothetical protein